MKEHWDQRYNREEYIYGLKPNEFFRSNLLKIKPGKILLPGDGEGRNAVFAAQLKWEVTAFDYSKSAKEKALKLANQNQVQINYITSDVETFETNKKFDVISLIYFHLPISTRTYFHNKISDLLSPNGIVLMECFSKEQIKNQSGGPKDINLLYSLDIIRNDFPNLNIELLEETETELDEGPLHQGKANVIRLIARKI